MGIHDQYPTEAKGEIIEIPIEKNYRNANTKKANAAQKTAFALVTAYR